MLGDTAIASSSMATELIKGKPLSEVLKLTNKAVTEAIDGLPAPLRVKAKIRSQ